ncbi:acetamidase/formamidase family protein [Alkalicoccus daliensis]|uniref:Acetamidase/formamidase n=1 Tax=Alkalicoccus daliensis TaxID=745820 RepID=A0A1G9ZK79_9BACI|nr:acetamidase/formamidase family protein [Alkalicoccus daliensis]SDN21411.1 Acetamidase/formamidase [Alkalicoccus daliensis]
MALHNIPLTSENLRGSFSREYSPAVTISSGDTLCLTTPDIEWGYSTDKDTPRKIFHPAEEESSPKHPVIGPVHIEGAAQGMTVEIHIEKLVPGWYGRNWGGGGTSWQNEAMQINVAEKKQLDWILDSSTGEATTVIAGKNFTVPMNPFLGLIGLQPRGRGVHPTSPPYYTGGNIDCKELTAGSRLFLPVEVLEAGLYVGDGHAAQGDGEVSGTAIECPMDEVVLTIHLHKEQTITQPYALTPAGLISFGFDTDLNIAAANALRDIIRRTAETYKISREEAAALASAVVDLRITQVVNGVKGVHAVLPLHKIKQQ